MSKEPLVSIIIVNYNGKNFINECVYSVLASNYPKFEVVLVDNASNDGSYELLKQTYVTVHPGGGTRKRIKIIRSGKQLYFTGGSNLGAKRADGEKLIFLNSDTAVTKNWLKELLIFTAGHEKFLVQPKILKFHPPSLNLPARLASKRAGKAGLRGTGVNTIDNAGGRYIFPGFGIGIGQGKLDHGQYNKNYPVDFVNGTCFMINRSFFWKLGGFDETFHYFYEDVDLCLRAKRAGGQCFLCGKSVIYHHRGKTIKKNLGQKETATYIKRNRRKTIKKNFSRLSKFLRLNILTLAELALQAHSLRSRNLTRTTYQSFVNYLHFWELKKFLKKKKFSLLDLGCGDGSFVRLTRQHGINALGVDKSPLPDLNFIASSIENLQLHQTFDVVTMFHVLEHVKNPEEVLRKATSFLKKDAVLVIEVPITDNLTEKFLGKNYFAYYDKTHLNFFTKGELLRLLGNAGFVVKKKGCTLFQFPLTVLTTSIKQGFWQTLKGIAFFVPLKLLTILDANDEILRLYCRSPKLP